MQPTITKSAMQNGLIMGILFSLNFLFSVSQNGVLQFLTNALFIGILVFSYKMLIKFRDNECDGVISYGKALRFIILTFFYAAIISSVVKYVFFQYINPGYLEQLTAESVKIIKSLKLNIPKKSMEEMQQTLKPAAFSFQFIWLNTLAGLFVGLVMAAFAQKGNTAS